MVCIDSVQPDIKQLVGTPDDVLFCNSGSKVQGKAKARLRYLDNLENMEDMAICY